MGADVGRRCEERIDVNWARWSDIWTTPDSISAVVPAVGLGRTGGESAVEMTAVLVAILVRVMGGVEVEVEAVAVAVAVVIVGAEVDDVGRREGDVAE